MEPHTQTHNLHIFPILDKRLKGEVMLSTVQPRVVQLDGQRVAGSAGGQFLSAPTPYQGASGGNPTNIVKPSDPLPNARAHPGRKTNESIVVARHCDDDHVGTKGRLRRGDVAMIFSKRLPLTIPTPSAYMAANGMLDQLDQLAGVDMVNKLLRTTPKLGYNAVANVFMLGLPEVRRYMVRCTEVLTNYRIDGVVLNSEMEHVARSATMGNVIDFTVVVQGHAAIMNGFSDYLTESTSATLQLNNVYGKAVSNGRGPDDALTYYSLLQSHTVNFPNNHPLSESILQHLGSDPKNGDDVFLALVAERHERPRTNGAVYPTAYRNNPAEDISGHQDRALWEKLDREYLGQVQRQKMFPDLNQLPENGETVGFNSARVDAALGDITQRGLGPMFATAPGTSISDYAASQQPDLKFAARTDRVTHYYTFQWRFVLRSRIKVLSQAVWRGPPPVAYNNATAPLQDFVGGAARVPLTRKEYNRIMQMPDEGLGAVGQNTPIMRLKRNAKAWWNATSTAFGTEQGDDPDGKYGVNVTDIREMSSDELARVVGMYRIGRVTDTHAERANESRGAVHQQPHNSLPTRMYLNVNVEWLSIEQAWSKLCLVRNVLGCAFFDKDHHRTFTINVAAQLIPRVLTSRESDTTVDQQTIAQQGVDIQSLAPVPTVSGLNRFQVAKDQLVRGNPAVPGNGMLKKAVRASVWPVMLGLLHPEAMELSDFFALIGKVPRQALFNASTGANFQYTITAAAAIIPDVSLGRSLRVMLMSSEQLAREYTALNTLIQRPNFANELLNLIRRLDPWRGELRVLSTNTLQAPNQGYDPDMLKTLNRFVPSVFAFSDSFEPALVLVSEDDNNEDFDDIETISSQPAAQVHMSTSIAPASVATPLPIRPSTQTPVSAPVPARQPVRATEAASTVDSHGVPARTSARSLMQPPPPPSTSTAARATSEGSNSSFSDVSPSSGEDASDTYAALFSAAKPRSSSRKRAQS